METYDRYNAMIHHGYLPVRVLGYNFIDWFLNITPDLKAEYHYEVDSNKLKESINYNINRLPITDIAHITDNHEIEIFENYCQFLWTCCYSFLVIFDEGIQKPTLNGTFNGNFLDTSNSFINRALDLFRSGLSLFKTYREDVFYRLPNPEKYNDYDKFYIERTSGIYSAAMTFILLHEFGHQYFGHVETYSDNDQSKSDEILADEFAFEKMETHFSAEEGTTYKFGILAGICSLIFTDSSLQGGDRHPDPDYRLKNLIEKMNLHELDNLWATASLPFNLWAVHFGKTLKYDRTVENYKDLFYKTINQLDTIKGSS
jgi:hypothetical protein